MLCANVKVSAEIYKKNNAKPPAGIRYTHPRGCVFSFYFKRIITGKAPWLPLGGRQVTRAAPLAPSVRELAGQQSCTD